MKYVKLLAKLFAVAILVVGLIFLFMYLYLASISKEDLYGQQINSIQKNLETQEAQLGIKCIEGDKLLFDYLNNVKLVLQEIESGKRMQGNEQILQQAEIIAQAAYLCSGHRRLMENYNFNSLSDLVIAEEATERELVVVRLSLAQTLPKWCHADCIQDAQVKIAENIASLEKRLHSISSANNLIDSK